MEIWKISRRRRGRTWSFHALVLRSTANECTKKCAAIGQGGSGRWSGYVMPTKVIFNLAEVSFFWRKSVFRDVRMQSCLALRFLVKRENRKKCFLSNTIFSCLVSIVLSGRGGKRKRPWERGWQEKARHLCKWVWIKNTAILHFAHAYVRCLCCPHYR